MYAIDKLTIEKRLLGNIAILDCAGRIVVGKENDFLFDAAVWAIERSECVLLNLSEISAVDSGGLGMLILLHRYATNSGCELKLCGATRRVANVLELTDLHTVLDLHENEHDALEHFFRDVA